MQLAKGMTVAGYHLISRIGRGGMGDVYRARQESLDRIVALKVLPPELSRNKEFASRFDSEAKVISMLEHHNIVSIYDYGAVEGNRFFAMQYVEGESLDQKIERERSLKVEQAIEISRQILRALKYAHEHNVIHRDIKPHNVLLDRTGKVFVSDFGIAKLFANTRITTTGMAVGTPEYMSPEQAEGAKLDAQTDIYSLGIVMYEMMVGVPPFTAESPLAVAYKQVNEQPKGPHEFNEAISPRLGMMVLKALKKDKKQRYHSVSEMLADLDSVAGEFPSSGRRAGSETSLQTEIDSPNRRITDRRMGDRRHAERRGYQIAGYPWYLWLPVALCLAILVTFGTFHFLPAQAEKAVRISRITGTSSYQTGNNDFQAPLAADGDVKTAWIEGAKGPGINEYVMITFRRTMILSRMGIWNGFYGKDRQTQGDPWQFYNRLKKVEISLSEGESRILELADRKGCQFFVLPTAPTSYLRLRILEIYPGAQSNVTPVSEVGLWGFRAR